MSYVKISWPDSQKYFSLPEDVLETLENEGTIVFADSGAILIDEDEIETVDGILETVEDEPDSFEESELPEDLKKEITAAAKKYSDKNKYDGDICLKKYVYLESRDSNVVAFYVWKEWIYLLTDDEMDVDLGDTEEEFVKTFLEYISDENNVYPED